ncbi:glycosyltransferase family 4 protein [Cellulomonas cellasea]|uniref:Glycosyl transferase family 1 n=2 Tax=Cellulomonas cellasea TaxID=43670 RepID=A0A0A0B382_9CELL|nr:glycosyltransferase family 1 protein [Cellulomonas cellasea]KGM01290.1 glycosyl transferase family 1 [Cellulomonas cellasea DSM 20118]GEA89964.1 glycosyl transferase [Cellulomonas cellasea]
MRALIDATAIPADRGGVGRYLDAVLAALPAHCVELVVASQVRDAAAWRALLPDAVVVTAPARAASRPFRLVWEQLALPSLARRHRVDVLLSPHYTMPYACRVPVVVTLHDATFFSNPGVHSPLKARFFRTATRLAVRRAAALVVPSAATRDEVLEHAGGRPEQFFVAPHGVDSAVFHPVDDTERARVSRTLGLDGAPYVAFLGTLEPRKNVPALVRAWARAVDGQDSPPALVLAGGNGWDEEVEPAIAAVPAHLRVVRAGYVPLEDLAGLLSGAEVLAYPSLGEGFGLPVLEAMACGAAVLTTRVLSLPEVGGDTVAYCGTDEASIESALRALLADEELRRTLASRAVERARLFTWDASAAVHAEAFAAAVRVARTG